MFNQKKDNMHNNCWFITICKEGEISFDLKEISENHFYKHAQSSEHLNFAHNFAHYRQKR